MEDIYNILSIAGDAWSLRDSSSNESFHATEFWQDDTSGAIKVKNRFIEQPEQRREWLSLRTLDTQSLVLRLVWITAEPEKNKVDLSEPVKQEILDEFGLGLAHSYFRTFTCGVTALPVVHTKEFERQAYAFCFAPKLASVFSHTRFKTAQGSRRTNSVTEGIIFSPPPPPPPKPGVPSKPEGLSKLDALKLLRHSLTKMPWDERLCRSPGFPAFLLSLYLSNQVQQTQNGIIHKVRQIESRTGHHDFKRDQEKRPPEELVELSAKTSGCATSLASISRKTAMIGELLQFVQEAERTRTASESSSEMDASSSRSAESEISLVERTVQVMQQRLKMQNLETDYLLKRVQVQLEAVFHLIAQNDNIDNLAMSASTRDLAEASSMIAFHSYRDSSSMKTLAIVTMFFLPGSFVSALFSTNLFDWNGVDLTKQDISVPTTPQMALYWAITAPLTVITFILYFVWLRIQKDRRQKVLDLSPMAALSTDEENSPSRLLAQKRLTESAALGRKRQSLARNSSLSFYNHPKGS